MLYVKNSIWQSANSTRQNTTLPGRNDERAISVEVYCGDRVRMRRETFERHSSFNIPDSYRLVE